MNSESSKFPVESAPRRTYTYTLKGRFGVAVAGVVMGLVMSLFIIIIKNALYALGETEFKRLS